MIRDLPKLGEWQGFEGRHIASRLSYVLGNKRQAAHIDYQNWKENRENHRAYFRALFTRFAFNAVMAALAVQIVLGITTVLYIAPWQLAIAHQLVAVLIWVLILRARFLSFYPISTSIREA